MCIYVYTYMYRERDTHMYIYIYVERERERERIPLSPPLPRSPVCHPSFLDRSVHQSVFVLTLP